MNVSVAVGAWVGVGVTVGDSRVGVYASAGVAGATEARETVVVGEGKNAKVDVRTGRVESKAVLGGRGVLVGVGVYAA